MFCPNCGKETADNSLFCAACGSKIEAEGITRTTQKTPGEYNQSVKYQQLSSVSAQNEQPKQAYYAQDAQYLQTDYATAQKSQSTQQQLGYASTHNYTGVQNQQTVAAASQDYENMQYQQPQYQQSGNHQLYVVRNRGLLTTAGILLLISSLGFITLVIALCAANYYGNAILSSLGSLVSIGSASHIFSNAMAAFICIYSASAITLFTTSILLMSKKPSAASIFLFLFTCSMIALYIYAFSMLNSYGISTYISSSEMTAEEIASFSTLVPWFFLAISLTGHKYNPNKRSSTGIIGVVLLGVVIIINIISLTSFSFSFENVGTILGEIFIFLPAFICIAAWSRGKVVSPNAMQQLMSNMQNNYMHQ